MNLEQISKKYNISDSFLNSKEDGLLVVSKSVNDLIVKLKKNEIQSEELIYSLEKLSQFCKDIKNSTFH
jgi:hypothetical protein